MENKQPQQPSMSNRFFGTKKQEEVKAKENPKEEKKEEEKPKEEKPKVDLLQQQSKINDRVKILSDQISDLDKQIKELYAKTQNQRGTSATMYKQRCLQLFRKKKMYEQQVQQLLSHQCTLDQITFTKENIQNTIEMGQAMKEAVEVQKEQFKDINLDQLEDVRDEMEDMIQDSNYINEELNRNFALDVNEAELNDDMKQLDDELLFDQLQSHKQQQPNFVQENKQQQVNQL